MYQTLVGDLTDGLVDVQQLVELKLQEFLANKKDLPEMWEAVVAEYKKRQKLDEEYALTQARLARILKHLIGIIRRRSQYYGSYN